VERVDVSGVVDSSKPAGLECMTASEQVHARRQRLLIATTVPETFVHILRDQPKFLNQHFDVAMVTSPGPDAIALDHEGVPVYRVDMQRGIHLLRDVWSVLCMVRLLLKLRPDMVHSYTPKAGLVCMLAAWVCRVPVRVHTFTGLIWPTAQGWRRGLLVWADRLLCACATHVVPEGLGVKRDLDRGRITAKALQPIGSGNIAGVDVGYFSPEAAGLTQAAADLRIRCGIRTSDFVYVFVGRLNRDKGVDELMSAFEGLPETCSLLLVGGVDETAPVGDATMRRLQANSRVHWLGFQHDIRPCLKAADVLVLPSCREGFPNVVLQAGAMALPVVATDISGCNEVIEPGLNGWLVPARDAGALAHAMRFASQTKPEALLEMGFAARARVVERFERQGHWGRMLAFYQSLLVDDVAALRGNRALLVGSSAESLINFRGPLIAALQTKGMDVHVAAPDLPPHSPVRLQLQAMGVTVHQVPMLRAGTNPLADLRTAWALWRLMRQIAPGMVLGYTIKPVIYGTLAAWLAGVPQRFALITGLGYAFQGDGRRIRLQALVQRLYGLALARAQRVFFQNPDDLALFQERGILQLHTPVCVVNGSGVDVASFAVRPLPAVALAGAVRFLFIGRLLGDKGVREYAEAARLLKRSHPQAQCALVGWIDSNPNAITQAELDGWVADGSIEFLGRLNDVRPAIEACSVYVLPSYREGTPRTVLESMAMGRAIITTDAPGCRETVVDGENGFLVPVQDAPALAQAMVRFIDEPALQTSMGARSRQMAEDKYDVYKVNAVMLAGMGLG
jgi:glycosyltransferase involved in cell wall biosynthesis